ncbi:dehydrogenase [Rhizobium leguminosarum]|uniref:dehydrogenase n=1 Tax=Rhizobium leguminosarum TaxID=384 RepID=UPI00103D3633|nr:dehydrogenase [Rhizobium leguminosarum]TBY27430.1 dehydrogenase [Rhizobium leguminosarum bv. viciae]
MLVQNKRFEIADQVDEAIAWHDGDTRATIETLLADCAHLREQLALASGCISKGLTRGWRPDPDRR